jgi:hypothetical protein
MPRACHDYMTLEKRPSLNMDPGKRYVVQTAPIFGPWKMYWHKPSIHQLCEPLLGSSVLNGSGIITGVQYPFTARRFEIYRKGIEVIAVFKEVTDLFALAVYRRYVTQRGGIPMDLLFFNLALSAGLKKAEWEMLGERMPDRSPIREACFQRARVTIIPLAELMPSVSIAA